MKPWFTISNIAEVDSPSAVLYEGHLAYNLHKMLEMTGGDTRRLRPHIKTNKMPEVIKRMIGLGIKNFKASTIAEAEMAAEEGADSVLIAHQLVGPKVKRLFTLAQRFPATEFSTIVDNPESAAGLDMEAGKRGNKPVKIYVDINNGMNRSGIEPGPELYKLIDEINNFNHLILKGLHVYDGHHRDQDYPTRKHKVEEGFRDILALYKSLKKNRPHLELISGGTPSFTSHLKEKERICSPGTCVFWDWGYNEKLTEQDFKFAVLLVSRVISKPTNGIVTIDLGHKAVASENPIHNRVRFLNLSGYELLSQSEEHGVLRVQDWENIKVGDVLYGVPYHICPTINLHDEVSVIRKGKKAEVWEITARRRRITI
ncbi:D-TA family PLP-dependent enzyme [Sinomicrobium weinanense]|uniref:D-TA family PLP-dependent enzyme n=1 Tax=Sinomicrobium weinanense TaxID=2842200 RepID=A0A926JVC0_9FLAO|nr:D-TA family PLP-dependent enzyme [Sinomicrobium weinanense]MBC9798155.1 D-TA family PLP-dependent enzyme [Sinomicrobium weinanense]MBU3122566.1 D-TA family PLP-dependent enzyme [Sinomicrobium weinanense]